MCSLGLQEIAARCTLPIRLIRYVLDHKVLPGTPYVQKPNERGKPREVNELEAFAIAIAAYLLDAGVRRTNVARSMRNLMELKGKLQRGLGDEPLATIKAMKTSSRLRIGADGRVIAISLGGVELSGPSVNAATPDGVVSVDVDLGAIRDRLFPKNG